MSTAPSRTGLLLEPVASETPGRKLGVTLYSKKR
jgi:hypothetical protein